MGRFLPTIIHEASEKYEYITKLGKPVIIMEPCRGGALAKLGEGAEKKLKTLRPGDSTASWAYRFAGSPENVSVVLSGVSNLEQAGDNVKTFSDFMPLSAEEYSLLESITKEMIHSIPCTECGYCMEGCPKNLNIPKLLKLYNDSKFAPSLTSNMALLALAEDKRPSACIECGACAQVCPQGIDIPKALKDFVKKYEEGPNWEKICKERIKQDRK